MQSDAFIVPNEIVAGQGRMWRAQWYVVEAVDRGYKTRTGLPSMLIKWHTRCPDCGDDVRFVTGRNVRAMRRRCVACQAPGKPVGRRRSNKTSDDELRALAVGNDAAAVQAQVELERRRRSVLRKLRWAMAHGETADDRARAEKELRRMRVRPETRTRKRAAEPAPSIFD